MGSLSCAGESIGVHVAHTRTPDSAERGRRLSMHLVTPAVQLDFVDLTPGELTAWAAEFRELAGLVQARLNHDAPPPDAPPEAPPHTGDNGHRG